MEKRKIIMDTDPGIDDAFAILTALAIPQFEVLGITTVSGNKSLPIVTPNALRLLDFEHKKIPVAEGAPCNLKRIDQKVEAKNDGGAFHGADGMGGSDLAYTQENLIETKAWDFILQKIQENPYEIELIALGPLTNLALAIQKDVATMKKLKSLTIMGGAFYHRGNVSEYSEFNIWYDPEAADMVMKHIAEDVPITYVGLDATMGCILSHDDIALLRYEGNERGALMAKIIQPYMDAYYRENKILGTVIHDLYTLLVLYDSTIMIKDEMAHVEIALDEIHSGQTCIKSGRSNARIALALDIEKLRHTLFNLLIPNKKER